MDRSKSGSGLIVAVLAAAGIVASVMQTLVVPLVGKLPDLLHTSASNSSWVVTATLLSSAVATPVTGRLGDLFGKRRMMLVCTLPLIAGSVVCALSSSLAPMVVGRGLQGLGMGVIPLGISALRDLVPPERLGSSIALISSSLGIGGALGLPFAAAVAEKANWHVLFWTAAGLSVLVAVLIWVVIPDTERAGARGRFDYAGALGLGAGLVCLLLGVSKGADWGWGSATTLGLIGTAVVVLGIWGLWELRTREPLVDLRVTARRRVLLTNAASIVIGLAMYGQALIIPQILQIPTVTGYGLGQSMLQAGLWMAPSGLMMMIISPLGARLSAVRGPKVTLGVGALVTAIGYGLSVALLGSTWGLLAISCVCSIGVGLAYGAMPALIMSSVPRSETAAANGFNTLMRAIGTTASSAIIGVVLAHMTTDLGGRVIPSETGFHVGMLIGCGCALAAAAVTLAIPARAREEDAEVVETTAAAGLSESRA